MPIGLFLCGDGGIPPTVLRPGCAGPTSECVAPRYPARHFLSRCATDPGGIVAPRYPARRPLCSLLLLSTGRTGGQSKSWLVSCLLFPADRIYTFVHAPREEPHGHSYRSILERRTR